MTITTISTRNILKVDTTFKMYIHHSKDWTFLQIIWYVSCTFINITTLFIKWNVINSIFVTLLLSFEKKKIAEALPIYHQKLILLYQFFFYFIKTCEYWFWRFKSGDFDLKDKDAFKSTKKVRRCRSIAGIGWMKTQLERLISWRIKYW